MRLAQLQLRFFSDSIRPFWKTKVSKLEITQKNPKNKVRGYSLVNHWKNREIDKLIGPVEDDCMVD